jgi:hemerythrin superfamily protein
MTAPTLRSVADQSVHDLGGEGSLLVRQRKDHALLQQLLGEVRRTRGPAQDEALTRLARLVFPHAYGEETVLWPVLRAALPDGEEVTLRNEQEHQQINQLWNELERTGDDERQQLLIARIADALEVDARDEEEVLLPRLQLALSARHLRRLGLLWGAVRRIAPTRPHAVVSRRPPGNLVSGLPLAVIDRSRDALDRSARRACRLAGPLSAASRALAQVAGALEHLPPIPWGERPSTHPASTQPT